MQIAFRNHINKNLSFLKGKRLLLAVSGGIDSVVLTHLMKKLKYDITLAHCNFGLRGKESNKDERFVLALGEQLNVPVYSNQFNTETYSNRNKVSMQMAARELRYNWFQELVVKHELDYILTAHHKEDVFETVLMNLIRGTGLDGITGIPEMNGNIIRPMLPFTRNDIIVYAARNRITWREDQSNSSIKYVRNKIRHKVVPVLKELNPNLLTSFDETLDHLKGSKRMVEDRILQVFKKTAVIRGNEIHFNIKKLKKLSTPKNYLYEMLHPYGFTAYNDIARLLEAQTGKRVVSATHQLLRNRGELILSPLTEDDASTSYEIIEGTKKLAVPIHLKFKPVNFNGDVTAREKKLKTVRTKTADNDTIVVDAERLQFPLTLRKWQSGDFFFPFGMEGKKKLSKFFKDEKMSLVDKEQTWLLCSGDDVIWVVGKRMDERFKLTSESTIGLQIKLKLHN